MFRVSATPIIRSTQNCNYSLRYLSSFSCSFLPPTWPSLATLEGGNCKVPEAVVTVLCNSDDGCDWHSKHVEWTCRIINRLLCVASRLTIINTHECNSFNVVQPIVFVDHAKPIAYFPRTQLISTLKLFTPRFTLILAILSNQFID